MEQKSASVDERPASTPDRGFSLSVAEKIIAVAIAVAGPLYPLGVLIVQRRLQQGEYRLESATARQAALLLPRASVVLTAVETLIAPWSIAFVILVGGVVAITVFTLREQQKLEALIGATPELKTPSWHRERSAWRRKIEAAYPYIMLTQTVTAINMLILNVPLLWVAFAVCSAIVSTLLIVRGLQGKPLLNDWMIIALLCAYLSSLVLAYHWPSPSQSEYASMTIAAKNGDIIEGGLLVHADGHWFILVKPATELPGQLVPISDDKADGITIAPRGVGTPRPRPARATPTP